MSNDRQSLFQTSNITTNYLTRFHAPAASCHQDFPILLCAVDFENEPQLTIRRWSEWRGGDQTSLTTIKPHTSQSMLIHAEPKVGMSFTLFNGSVCTGRFPDHYNRHQAATAVICEALMKVCSQPPSDRQIEKISQGRVAIQRSKCRLLPLTSHSLYIFINMVVSGIIILQITPTQR